MQCYNKHKHVSNTYIPSILKTCLLVLQTLPVGHMVDKTLHRVVNVWWYINKSSHKIHWIQSKRNMEGKRDMKWPYTYLEHFKIAIDVNSNISSPILWKTYLFPRQKTSLGSWNFFFLVFRLIVLFPLLKKASFSLLPFGPVYFCYFNLIKLVKVGT